jgi:diguanylate cyclase (GGDEF)-like protein
MRLGAFDYLLKPCDDSELKLRIERGLKERRLLKKVESQNKKLEKMAITDSLTGLYSRSYFMEALDREYKHFNRYRTPLSFMMIDIDHFKRINDRFGHQAGDEVLKKIAKRFMKIIREADVIGRYGGEEFGVIQPRTDVSGSTRTADRILSALREDPEMVLDNVKVRVSIGIATCPHKEINDPAQLIKAADTALYQAKRAGRDRMVVFDAREEKESAS